MNYNKETIKKIIIILITAITIIATIIYAIYFINKGKKETQTFLPSEEILINTYNNVEKIEHIIAILPPSNTNEENTKEQVNNIENNSTGSQSQNTSNYYIKVNYGANVVNIYTKDADGNYTVPYKAMICSTGTSTPASGIYSIKLKWKWLALFGDVYGYYTTQIVGNILFHSVPYLEKGNPASLEYWEYDKLGTSASMGCIRLKVEDAMWIYNNCPSGTMVEFYSSSNPGPLGKPSVPKISGYDSPYRDWDPTDPDSSNPWKKDPPQSNEPTNTTEPENKIENNTSDNIIDNTVTNSVNNNTIENNTNTIMNSITNNIIDNSTNDNSISNNTDLEISNTIDKTN